MRVLVAVCLCVLGITCGEASETRWRLPSVTANGQEYVDLQRWADQNRFHFSSSRKDKEEEVQLSSRSSKIVFKVNSLRAEIDGILLFLAYPVISQQGTVYVAHTDLERSLRPILFPTKMEPRGGIRTVVVSAGHGGKDSGYQIRTYQEKFYTLLLAKEVQRLLSRAGFKPILVRATDELVEYEDRAKLAKRSKADIYLELHYNSAGLGNSEPRGCEVYCLTPAGASSTNGGSNQYGGGLPGNRHDGPNVLLAYHIHRHLVQGASLGDRGVRRARFVVLRDAEMPAVLVEAGFMSNPDEMRKIDDTVHRRRTAQAIVDGLVAYKKLVER